MLENSHSFNCKNLNKCIHIKSITGKIKFCRKMQTPLNVSRLLHCGKRLFFQLKNVSVYHRTYLSEAYKCDESWNKRLDSDLLKQVNASDMFFEIERKFQTTERISAVDVDIFANVIHEKLNTEEIISLLEKLRRTTEASNILPSTHHAVIRFFLQINDTENLLNILFERLKFGIFPDTLCYNIMMDTFLKKEDFASAAKVATLLMIQEDFDNQISNNLALYSCHRYLEKPDEWKAKVIVKDEPEEEVKVRVKYLREPFFDDHFDLIEPSDLVGKTLSWYGKHVGNTEGRSCQLRGLILYKKYSAANKLIEGWMKENIPDVIYKETLSLIQKDVGTIFENEMNEDVAKLKSLLDRLMTMNLKEGSLTEALENNVKSAIEKQEKIDIETQQKTYVEWEEWRLKVLHENLAERNRQQKKAEFAAIKKELEDKERVLTFFDKEEEIELKIEEKLRIEKEKYGHIKVKEDSIAEDYIPPDIRKTRQM